MLTGGFALLTCCGTWLQAMAGRFGRERKAREGSCNVEVSRLLSAVVYGWAPSNLDWPLPICLSCGSKFRDACVLLPSEGLARCVTGVTGCYCYRRLD